MPSNEARDWLRRAIRQNVERDAFAHELTDDELDTILAVLPAPTESATYGYHASDVEEAEFQSMLAEVEPPEPAKLPDDAELDALVGQEIGRGMSGAVPIPVTARRVRELVQANCR